MYKDGLKIGDIFYLVSEEDGKISLLSGSTKKEDMEEYIKLDNEYFEKIENINNIQNKLINIHNLDRLSRKWNIRILLTNMLVGGFSLLIGHTITISIVGLIILNSGLLIMKKRDCLTKRKRTKLKQELKEEVIQINEDKKISKIN